VEVDNLFASYCGRPGAGNNVDLLDVYVPSHGRADLSDRHSLRTVPSSTCTDTLNAQLDQKSYRTSPHTTGEFPRYASMHFSRLGS
jgi:hypothetical protein